MRFSRIPYTYQFRNKLEQRGYKKEDASNSTPIGTIPEQNPHEKEEQSENVKVTQKLRQRRRRQALFPGAIPNVPVPQPPLPQLPGFTGQQLPLQLPTPNLSSAPLVPAGIPGFYQPKSASQPLTLPNQSGGIPPLPTMAPILADPHVLPQPFNPLPLSPLQGQPINPQIPQMPILSSQTSALPLPLWYGDLGRLPGQPAPFLPQLPAAPSAGRPPL
ncbi:unnamed protein product [Gongylonema pulchrum]|uniref:Homeobox domain-containing protein n=1 Tax=Gongylonema pulchrum TaxID=637853 RepID=A0A183DZ99_9BILA|nr:unnamed protein product [Gongylonema pulchrum]